MAYVNPKLGERIIENDPLSKAFDDVLKAANMAASGLVRLGMSLSQGVFESDMEWIKKLKELDADSYEAYKEVVTALTQLNSVISQYESLKQENNFIFLNKRTVERFLEYIPMVKHQLSDILKQPDNPDMKDAIEKIKNTYHEFMAKAKYIVPELKKIDSSIKSFEELFNSQIKAV